MRRLHIAAPGTFWIDRIATAVMDGDTPVHVYTTAKRNELDVTLPDDRFHRVQWAGALKWLGYQIPDRLTAAAPLRWNRPVVRLADAAFDRAVAARLAGQSEPSRDDPSLFLGFAGACGRSLHRANDLGHTTAVERSSTHVRAQRETLIKEYNRWGVSGQPVSAAHVRREEREYERADFVVTPSSFAAETLVTRGVPESKVRVVPFGASVDEIDLSIDRSTDPPTVLFAGRASLRKGIGDLLAAWERLDHDARLVVAGHVDDAAAEIVAEHAGRPTVEFAGWVDDIDRLYREASVFVLPSVEEGSARVTYEAMARGLPVVTTPNSGWVGADGVHGLEVSPRDPEALADALDELLAAPDRRRRLGRAAHDHIAGSYTWDDYSQRVRETYRGMVAEARR